MDETPADDAQRLRRAGPLLKLAVLCVLALGAGATMLALSLDTARPVSSGGLDFEYLAHHTIMRNEEPSDVPDWKRFGGISGVAYVPGSLEREGETVALRAHIVSDSHARARVYELLLTFTRTDGGWSLDVTNAGEINLRHPRRDGESLVILSQDDSATTYAISYERPPTIAVLRDPPRPIAEVRTGRNRDARLLDVPQDILSRIRGNRGFESLALRTTPGGARELWAPLESSLEGEGDGATGDAGARCRVLVYRVHDAENITLDRTLEYVTEPLPDALLRIGRFNSLADATDLPDGSLAFMERHAAALGGYDATLFRVSEQPDGTLAKTRLASVKEIAGPELPWVGNYEGVTLGPTMADFTGDENERGHLMLLVADDNFGSDYQLGTQILAVRVSDNNRERE